MYDKIKKYFDLIPIIVPVIYIIGFFVINGYLSNYNFSDYNILNFTYLKAGILVSILIALLLFVITISYTKETMTDGLTKSWRSILVSIFGVLMISVVLSFILIDPMYLIRNHKTAFFIIKLSFAFFALSLLRINFIKSPKNISKISNYNWFILKLIVPPIIFLSVIICTLCFYYLNVLFLLMFNITIFWIYTIMLGEFGDKGFNPAMAINFLAIIVSSFFFGKFIYGRIPSNFGGGQQHEIVVYKSSLINDLVNENRTSDTLRLIYENDNGFLITEKNKSVIFIEKSEIKAYKILR